MILASRLDCPLSLKTPNMGNPGCKFVLTAALIVLLACGESPALLRLQPQPLSLIQPQLMFSHLPRFSQPKAHLPRFSQPKAQQTSRYRCYPTTMSLSLVCRG